MRVIDLNRIVSFQSRGETDDGYGNKVTGYAERFREWASIKPLKGGEDVLQARLSARQPAILTVRADDPRIAGMDETWIGLTSDDVIWHFQEPPRLSDDRLFAEILVRRGGPKNERPGAP